MCFSNILFHLVEEQSFMVLRPSNIVEQSFNVFLQCLIAHTLVIFS